MPFKAKEQNASQEFLDSSQYSLRGVLQYERIFGEHFVSTGGKETTAQFTALLNLQPGMKVLDIGCGIGGSAFYMASTYGVHVHGIDLSQNMLSIAKRSASKMKFPSTGGVTFEQADATKMDFPEASFDVIYSRDCLMHVGTKLLLFSKFRKWLRPGGKVFISDYITGPMSAWSAEMTEYYTQRDYKPIELWQYKDVLEKAGLVNVIAKDQTLEFIDVLKREIAYFKQPGVKQRFIDEWSEDDYNHILDGWERKAFERCPAGYQRWGVFYAEKSSESYSNILSKL